MNAEEMWNEYKRKNGITCNNYEAWAFGGNPDLLAKLVTEGIKTATSSAYPVYEIDKSEPLPEAGQYSVILNSKEEAVCIIRTDKVYITSFKNVGKEHAFKEGEGDKSLEYWRKVHIEFFTGCMEKVGLKYTDDMKVVCEEFKMVYR